MKKNTNMDKTWFLLTRSRTESEQLLKSNVKGITLGAEH